MHRALSHTIIYFVTIAASQVLAFVFLPVVTGYLSLAVMLAAGAAVLAGDFYAHAVSLVRAEQQAGHFAIAEVMSALLRLGATLLALSLGARSSSVLFLAAALAVALMGA